MRPADRARRDRHMRFPRARHTSKGAGRVRLAGDASAAVGARTRTPPHAAHAAAPARAPPCPLYEGDNAHGDRTPNARTPRTCVTLPYWGTLLRGVPLVRHATRHYPFGDFTDTKTATCPRVRNPRGQAAPGALTLLPERVYTISRYPLHGAREDACFELYDRTIIQFHRMVYGQILRAVRA